MTIIIFLNFLMYLCKTLYVRKKYPSSLYYYFWLYFCVFSGASVFIVATGIYELRFSNLPHNTDLSIIPYILLFICVNILLYPLRTIGRIDFSLNRETILKLYPIVIALIAILIIYILIKLFELSIYSHYSIMERREMSVTGDTSMTGNGRSFLWYADFFLWMIHDIVTPFLLFYSTQGFLKKCISIRKLLLIISCILVPMFITYWNTSNRSGLFFLIVNLVFFMLILKKQIPKTSFKKLVQIGLIVTIPFIITLSLISSARYENSDMSVQNGVLSYFGEMFPNLGAFVYDQNYRFTYGIRLFPRYFEAITGYVFNIDSGLQNYHIFWQHYTGVYILVFKTIFGDLYLEFGAIGSIIFIALIALSTNLVYKKNKNIFFIVSLTYLYICFCSNAVFDFGLAYGGYYVPRYVVGCFLLSIILKKFIPNKNSAS